MALDLNEYIKMSYKRPNRKVLEGLGASEGLIEYLMETPGNTNWNIIDSIMNSGGGGDAEVWLVGDTYQDIGEVRDFNPLNNVGDVDHIAELLVNGENYQVFLNGEELPYLISQSEAGVTANIWADSEDESTITKVLQVVSYSGNLRAIAEYADLSTAPTSVEVSVKTK